jgi:hypothetical protein
MPKPNIQFSTPEKYWDDAKEGDECTSPSYTVTAARIDAYAELTGRCMSMRNTPATATLASVWRTA